MYIPKYFLVCKGISNDDVGWQMQSYSRDARPGAGFKSGGFVKPKVAGARAVERRHPFRGMRLSLVLGTRGLLETAWMVPFFSPQVLCPCSRWDT